MKIKPNMIHYIAPVVIALICMIATVSTGVTSFVLGVVILVCCVIHRNYNTLELKDGMLTGTQGLKKLSVPVAKVQYCEYTGVGVFNHLRINAVTGQYDFKYMTHAKEFASLVNEEMK